MNKDKTNKISIYLLKVDKNEDDILKSENNYTKIKLENGLFYYRDSYKYEPSWVKNFFVNGLGNDDIHLF